jgi:hypothetical protein
MSVEFTLPKPLANPPRLRDADFIRASELLGCEEACIRAVTEVESSGDGFLKSGRPRILYEAHVFSRLTSQKFDKTNPALSSQTWNRELYQGGEAEYDRLDQAMMLDRKCALMATSWGLFQIMGSNYLACGLTSVEDMVAAMYASERYQLEAFVNFSKRNSLDIMMRLKAWQPFALKYNGPGYARNGYDIKLKKAYEKLRERQ